MVSSYWYFVTNIQYRIELNLDIAHHYLRVSLKTPESYALN